MDEDTAIIFLGVIMIVTGLFGGLMSVLYYKDAPSVNVILFGVILGLVGLIGWWLVSYVSSWDYIVQRSNEQDARERKRFEKETELRK